MGVRLVRFEFRPGENEQLEAIIRLPQEPQSVIHGVVMDHSDRIVKDGVVKLFEVENSSSIDTLKPIAHTFTDECGHFLFGPLDPYKDYVLKIWVDDVSVRKLLIDPSKDNTYEYPSKDTLDSIHQNSDVSCNPYKRPKKVKYKYHF